MASLKDWAEHAKHGDQKELAELLGVSQATLNHWITGRRLPTLGDGLRLQSFLKKQRRRK